MVIFLKTVSELLTGSDDLVNNIYKVEGKVVNYVSSYYTNKRFYDPNEESYLTLYCGNASQIAWLDDYEGTVRTAYIFVRDKKNSNARFEILAFEN